MGSFISTLQWTDIDRMVKADIPEHSRDCSPDKLSLVSSHGMPSRTSSSASCMTADTLDTTRESSPDYRLEISIRDSANTPFSNDDKEKKRNSATEKTPIPADSPLFAQPPVNESIKQLKNFNRSLKKAQSFRAAREKIDKTQSRCSSVPDVPISGEWVTFIIKKTTLGRNGWKIMTENENMNLRVNREIIDLVTERIRDLQFSGEAVPDKMTLYIK